MKNRIIEVLIIIMIFLIILTCISFFRYKYNLINDSIFNKNYYRYDNKTGYYSKLLFNKNKVSYYLPSSINENTIFDNCSSYNYDKKNNTIKLDCNSNLQLLNVNDKSISININDNEYVFFDTINDSLNYEFESYYGKSIIDYKKDKKQVFEYSKINTSKLYEVIKEDEYSKIVFSGSNCSSVECVLVLDIMEKWISMSNNIYYYDTENLDESVINYLNKILNVEYDINYYNDSYPRVLIVKNNKIIDSYLIKCNGFSCYQYFKNEF